MSATLAACATTPVLVCSLPFPQPNQTGSLLRADVIAIGPIQDAQLSDTSGNVWMLLATMARPDTGGLVESWYAVNARPGPNTVSVSFQSPQSPKFSIYEDAGIATTAPLLSMVTGSSTPTGDPTSSMTIPVPSQPALLTAVIDIGPPSGFPTVTSAASGWTLHESIPHGAGEERVVTATGDYAGGFDWTPSGAAPWAMIGASYAACSP